MLWNDAALPHTHHVCACTPTFCDDTPVSTPHVSATHMYQATCVHMHPCHTRTPPTTRMRLLAAYCRRWQMKNRLNTLLVVSLWLLFLPFLTCGHLCCSCTHVRVHEYVQSMGGYFKAAMRHFVAHTRALDEKDEPRSEVCLTLHVLNERTVPCQCPGRHRCAFATCIDYMCSIQHKARVTLLCFREVQTQLASRCCFLLVCPRICVLRPLTNATLLCM